MKRTLLSCLAIGLLTSLSTSSALAMNKSEAAFCANPLHWSDCNAAFFAAQVAEQETNRQFSNLPDPQADNIPSNAFKHCYWNAAMTFAFGKKKAKGFADRHEYFEGNDELSKQMDLHNNKKGRQWARKIKKKWPYDYWRARAIRRCKNNSNPGGDLIRYRGYRPGDGPDVSRRSRR